MHRIYNLVKEENGIHTLVYADFLGSLQRVPYGCGSLPERLPIVLHRRDMQMKGDQKCGREIIRIFPRYTDPYAVLAADCSEGTIISNTMYYCNARQGVQLVSCFGIHREHEYWWDKNMLVGMIQPKNIPPKITFDGDWEEAELVYLCDRYLEKEEREIDPDIMVFNKICMMYALGSGMRVGSINLRYNA